MFNKKVYHNIFIPVLQVGGTSGVGTKRLTVPFPIKCYSIHRLFYAQNFPWPQPRNDFSQPLSASHSNPPQPKENKRRGEEGQELETITYC